jgi:hypothetical protein
MAESAKKAIVNKVMDMTETECRKIMPAMQGMMTGGMMGAEKAGLSAGQKKLPPALQKAIIAKKKK